jgi:hypothetical protein
MSIRHFIYFIAYNSAYFSHSVFHFLIYFFDAIDDSVSFSLSYAFLSSWGGGGTLQSAAGQSERGYATCYYHWLIYIILLSSISLVRISFTSNPQSSSRFYMFLRMNQWRTTAVPIFLIISSLLKRQYVECYST